MEDLLVGHEDMNIYKLDMIKLVVFLNGILEGMYLEQTPGYMKVQEDREWKLKMALYDSKHRA